MQRKRPFANWHGFKALPYNLPLPLPGVYLIQHIDSGLGYVGSSTNVANRLFEHARGGSNVPAVYEALRAHHRSSFLILPLYYHPTKATKKAAGIATVEEAMIVAYNCYNHGWNRPRADVATLSKLPQNVAKRLATEASQATKAKRSAMMLARYADPAYKAKHLASTTHANQQPERNAKMAATKTGRMWITDGTKQRSIPKDVPVPPGWWIGRT